MVFQLARWGSILSCEYTMMNEESQEVWQILVIPTQAADQYFG